MIPDFCFKGVIIPPDLLAFFAAVGTVVSSTLTLLIFFPRSLAKDSNWLPHKIETQSHGSFYSSGTENNEQSGTTLNAKSTTVGINDFNHNGNPFSRPRDTMSPTSALPTISKSKYKYYNGHFTVPSTLATTYYPPALCTDSEARLNVSNIELRSIEEGDGIEYKENHSRMLDSDTALVDIKGDATANDTRDKQRSETNDRYGEIRAPKDKDNLQQKTRMIELANAVEAGLKRSPRTPRLHPYVRYMHGCA